MKWLILATFMIGQFAFAQSDDLVLITEGFVDQLASGDFESAISRFDDTMIDAMPITKLSAIWKQIENQVGKFEKQIGTRTQTVLKYEIVFVTCKFEKAPLDCKVVFNKEKQISGLFFLPATLDADQSKFPKYVDLEKIEEIELEIGEAPWILPATLTIPKNSDGPFSAIVLVHGSGPNDRDETIGPNKPFRDLALGLTTKGIAVLRYDKRTKIYPKEIAENLPHLTVKEEAMDDALFAVEKLRKIEAIDKDRIFVLGHSLGGMLIPRIAKRSDRIAGFVIMAGATRPLEDLMLEQIEYIQSIKNEISDEEQKQINMIKSGVEQIKQIDDETPIDTQILGVSVAYWRDLQNFDPAAETTEINKPILILQGARDYQVTLTDFNNWKNALIDRKNVIFKIYPKLNHLFMPGSGKSEPTEYLNPNFVDFEVIRDIADWISK